MSSLKITNGSLINRGKNLSIKNSISNDTMHNGKMSDFPAIVVKNMTKKFRNFIAIDKINFVVKKGTIHGFVGPNGAGKTTTIKCLISAMIINSGQALINNYPSSSLAAKKLIGYIPENTNFPKGISTYQFLISMCQLNGLSKTESIARINNQLNAFNLTKFKNKSPNSYSSGMKKKVLLIQALANEPDVIIMDEPAANLDPSARTDLFNELKALKKAGKTIVISSHILTELQEIADEITILNKGQVVYSGPLQNQAATKYEIKSSNDETLYNLLEAHNFIVTSEIQLVCVQAKTNDEINKISRLALENKITIYSFQLQSTNLQKLYEEMVMDVPKENK